MKKCDAVNDNMIAYRDLYNQLEGSFDGCELNHIAHASNEEADTLANIGSRMAPIPDGVFLEQINERSIKVKAAASQDNDEADQGAGSEAATSAMIDTVDGQVLALTLAEPPSWTKPYIAYILRKGLPDNPTDARMIARRSKAFQVINGELYKRSISV